MKKETTVADVYSSYLDDIERLQKKLNIATKALELYSKDDFYTKGGGRYSNPNPMVARQALKEMEEV